MNNSFPRVWSVISFHLTLSHLHIHPSLYLAFCVSFSALMCSRCSWANLVSVRERTPNNILTARMAFSESFIDLCWRQIWGFLREFNLPFSLLSVILSVTAYSNWRFCQCWLIDILSCQPFSQLHSWGQDQVVALINFHSMKVAALIFMVAHFSCRLPMAGFGSIPGANCFWVPNPSPPHPDSLFTFPIINHFWVGVLVSLRTAQIAVLNGSKMESFCKQMQKSFKQWKRFQWTAMICRLGVL